jgi:sugar lactone lactonase YvrE
MSTALEVTYETVPGWEQLPEGFVHRDVSDVGVDSHDRVYLLTRNEARVFVYERDGTFVDSWGGAILSTVPHGLTVGPDDTVYVVDQGDQTVRSFTPDGHQLSVVGTSGVRSDTGIDWTIPWTSATALVGSIQRSGPPFNNPTSVAIADGDLYVADGYGNARIHRFSSEGELLASWGEPGSDPGQFRIPHSVCFDRRGLLLVADRENERIQVFTPDGAFVEEWLDVQRPTGIAVDPDGLVYVTELAWRPGDYSWRRGRIADATPCRLTIFSPTGTPLARFGDGRDPCAPGSFVAAHGVAVDSHGDLYVAEPTYTFLGRDAVAAEGCHTFQKLAKTPTRAARGSSAS